MSALAVFIGSSPTSNPAFVQAAIKTGQLIAQNNASLIYGGSAQGLMGLLARSALSAGAKVTGITTRILQGKEIIQQDLTQLIWTDTIAERIATMNAMSDGILILPGGLGTLEELFILWNQIRLGLINKPLGILNVNNYYTPLFNMIGKMESERFISEYSMSIPLVGEDINELYTHITGSFAVPKTDKDREK